MTLPWEREGVTCGDEALLEIGRSIILNEAAELTRAAGSMGSEWVMAARAIYRCKGRVVVVGLGKSGHVGRKISATLSSLGTPSSFLHAAEGMHGDLGMVRREDVGVFVSNSGGTEEVLAVVPHFKRLGAVVIAITGGVDSPLARHADIVVEARVESEADPLGLAPTSSTTLQLVVGDALAGMVTKLRGLRKEDFATFHPGGVLGRRLLTKVSDVMGPPEQLPKVEVGVLVKDALFEITDKKYGATCVVDASGKLVGIFTDGDLRRLLEKNGVEALNHRIDQCMTRNPAVIGAERLAVEAVREMEKRAISVLIVVRHEDRHKEGPPVGMIHLHQLLREGIA
jgi:arabinose-5-phosphate isomerase